MIQPNSVPYVPHERSGRLLVLEGDPGSGKTTTIASLASVQDISVIPELDHTAMPDPPSWACPEEWYVDAERQRQPAIDRLLAAGRTVVEDRSVLSTLAFAYACHRRHTRPAGHLRRLIERLRSGPFIQPDSLVILSVDAEVGIARRPTFSMSARYREWFDLEFLTYLHDYYSNMAASFRRFPVAVLDTSRLAPRATRDFVSDLVSGVPRGKAQRWQP